MRRLSSCGTQACSLLGVWDLPKQGQNPWSPARAGRFSTTEPPGKPDAQPALLCLSPRDVEERGIFGILDTGKRGDQWVLAGLSWSLASAVSICPSPDLVALAGAVHGPPGCHAVAMGAVVVVDPRDPHCI